MQLISDGPGPVKIRQRRGRGWNYTARPIPGVPATQRDIAFDEAEIAYELRGLSAGRHYTVGLTWWDFNTTERRASVWASRLDGGGATRLLEPTALPSHVRRSQLPGRLRLDLPAKLTRSGTARLSIRRAGGANAVICELWIVARPPPAQTPAKVH